MILLSQLAMRRRLGPAAAELAFPVPLWPWGQRCAVVFMLFVFAVLAAFEDTRGALYVAWAGSRCCRRPISGCPRCVGTRAAHRGLTMMMTRRSDHASP